MGRDAQDSTVGKRVTYPSEIPLFGDVFLVSEAMMTTIGVHCTSGYSRICLDYVPKMNNAI